MKSIYKKSMIIVISQLLLTSFIFSQSWNFKQGWDLKGSSGTIEDLSVFTSECVEKMYSYNKGETSIWSTYPGDLTTIKAGKGFWINMKKDCTIQSVSAEEKALQENMTIASIEVNGETRQFKFYTPTNLTNDASLIFYFHGGIAIYPNTPSSIENGLLSYLSKNHVWSKIADTENIMVVYPLGSIKDFTASSTKTSPSRATDRYNKEYNWIYSKDLDYFDKLLEYFTTNHPKINSKKVYISGHSAGASFTFRLAGERTSVLAGAVAVSGRLKLTKGGVTIPGYDFIKDEISIPLMAFHGSDDGKTKGMESNLDDWHTIENHGSLEGATKVDLDIGKYSLTKKTYKGGISDLEFYVVKNQGHRVPWDVLGYNMWDFLKSHVRED